MAYRVNSNESRRFSCPCDPVGHLTDHVCKVSELGVQMSIAAGTSVAMLATNFVQASFTMLLHSISSVPWIVSLLLFGKATFVTLEAQSNTFDFSKEYHLTGNAVSDAYCSPLSKELEARWTRPWRHESGSSLFIEQMKNPSEVFSVVLIIGGDIVQKAIAQVAGRHVTFIAFSFGWVAYAFNALMSAFGDGSLMPDPDYPASVILVSSRIRKSNEAWIIGRLIRDLEREVIDTFTSWYEDTPTGRVKTDEGDSGLLITFYKV